ncbi:MAG: CoA pyrophosphatase, partial [Actinomycetota bacterium]|nr:CoA pyrophosphatase [Actinomycetota bacterium]
MSVWTRLAESLAAQASQTAPPRAGRLAAALVLLGDCDGDLEVVYTRRRQELRHHPGQISFPGGRVEPGETVEQTALREAHEEIALDVATVELLGRLPATYIPPSRFWLQPVVARWRAPHPLAAAEAEVAAVLRVRLSRLRDVGSWRMVRLSTRGDSWAWQLDADHLLWGATAVVTVSLLDMLVPG